MVDFDIVALKKGELAEFTALFKYYTPKLIIYFRNKFIEETLIEDVIQITFIKIWNKKENLNESIKLSTQVFQIAKTTMIDELRSYNNRVLKKTEYLKTSNINYCSPIVEDTIDKRNLDIKFNNVIDKLPPNRKKIFLMRKDDHLSNEEIAKELHISVKTVNKHIQLAIRQMKPFFAQILS